MTMRFEALPVAGAYIVERQPVEDSRGFFSRLWCREEFEAMGLDTTIEQCSMSLSVNKGTLRGMHFQLEPYAEIKLIRCTAGAMYDVLLDLRTDSPSYLKWCSIELTPENGRQVYIPKGIAHGFLSLKDNTEMCYQISARYSPDHARGVRWDDPAFGIEWPEPVRVISDKDSAWADYDPAQLQIRTSK